MLKKVKLVLLGVLMGALSPALAAQTREVTDHLGNTVQVPVAPQRVASLHTMSTTVMLMDLGVPLIGTATRLKQPGNVPYIRSAEELFGVKFEDTDYFNYGKFGSDIEQIKLSQPDLIVATYKHAKNYAQLSAIAPTILVNYQHGDIISVYRDVATWVGKRALFDARYAQYQERLTAVRKTFSTPPADQTVIYAHADPGKANISVRRHYGSVTQVAYDLGFKEMPFVLEQFPGDSFGGRLSAEVIGDINANYVLSSYRHQIGETPQSVYDGFDDVAPGWRDYISAYQRGTFITLNREKGYGISFVALNYVLDQFAAAAK